MNNELKEIKEEVDYSKVIDKLKEEQQSRLQLLATNDGIYQNLEGQIRALSAVKNGDFDDSTDP